MREQTDQRETEGEISPVCACVCSIVCALVCSLR